MKTPVYVSFYTDAYREEAGALVDSLDRFGLEEDVRHVPDQGSWVRNCAMKSAFIFRMLVAHPGRPIVWLDADARVRQHPDVFNALDCDFAAHWRHGVELLSGTMYFGPTLAARMLVATWRAEQERTPDEWDQRVLQRVIESDHYPDLRVVTLPPQYTRVFDDPKMGVPVIEHMQASRRLAKAAG
jgi:hypothetical protein